MQRELISVSTRILTHHPIVQVDHAAHHVADLNFPPAKIPRAVVPFQTLRDTGPYPPIYIVFHTI